jgi:hypothetical protein
MQISSTFKTIFAAGIALLIISCSDSKEKVKVQEITLQDVKQEENNVEPPPPPNAEVKKCYASDGLKYKTVVTLIFVKKNGTDIVSGNVTSEELGSGKTEKGVFEGTIDGDKYMIKFMGNPPTVGDASQWTDKAWTIEKVEGKGQWKEKLHIIFNAKNYETNKWEDTDYQFVLVDCK